MTERPMVEAQAMIAAGIATEEQARKFVAFLEAREEEARQRHIARAKALYEAERKRPRWQRILDPSPAKFFTNVTPRPPDDTSQAS